ncbi:2-phosphosulfolactate phosphatase [Ammoniphilus resinae]|uniref:Probable 2-phosphosulfolactate phosphatase n=1 Tax=Ammoniphilus resinae TaxID=861532 RepID=A0ABS4GV77_9BACL|nr:2-phosphosulfolactate phosphatase [Ammoniphilus resinae]MBP1934171.1 2-phosphosulfolactate phosphatase [Ammoniphilus resinae]
MKVDVVSNVDEVKWEDIKNKAIIVIDVLRATSTIITALAYGAKEVIPVETLGQARQYRGEQYLLAGERYSKRVSGFPYANSPTEIQQAPLQGATLVLTTTNGTRAIQKSLKAELIAIGSFLNGTACANWASANQKDLTILCSGSRGKFALEDGMAAGYILNRMNENGIDLQIDDLGQAMMAAYEHNKDLLPEVMQTTATGHRLLQNGYLNDILFCAQRDCFSFVPIVSDHAIVIHFLT